MASPTSVKLFTAWAAKHKEVLAIEDRWTIALRDGRPEADAIRAELEQARRQAGEMLASAQALFHQELRDRGIRE